MTGAGNNTYLLVGDDETATLIDAGVGRGAHLRAISRHLADAHARLARVLVTHAHPDHASGAAALAAAHPRAAFYKHPWPGEDARYPVAWLPLEDQARIEIGGETLITLHTPGHAPDHLAFWHEGTRTVFVGDLVIAGGRVMIHASRGGDMSQYLAALARIRALAPSRLWPAHGEPIDEPASVLAQFIEHRLAREAQVVAALEAGRATVPGIVEFIYDGLDPAVVPAAEETVRAHLEKLRREARAAYEAGRWMLRSEE